MPAPPRPAVVLPFEPKPVQAVRFDPGVVDVLAEAIEDSWVEEIVEAILAEEAER